MEIVVVYDIFVSSFVCYHTLAISKEALFCKLQTTYNRLTFTNSTNFAYISIFKGDGSYLYIKIETLLNLNKAVLYGKKRKLFLCDRNLLPRLKPS